MKPLVREKLKGLVPVMVIVFAFTCLGLNQVVFGQALEKIPEKALKGAVKEVIGSEKEAAEKEAAEKEAAKKEAAKKEAAKKDQARMQKILKALKTAKAELKAAAPNKGGHRVKAIKAIDRAVKEVNLGIDYMKTKK